MSEQLSDEERELLEKHRAAKARQAGRKVKIKGRHEDSGADYEFELEGDEAERVISRHKGLWADEEETDDGDGADDPESGAGPARKRSAGSAGGSAPGAGQARKAPAYFKR